jgi:hypothetical protein
MSYYVFIVSSRNSPCYEKFDSIRRKHLKGLAIPYKFLLNGALPEGYVLKDDEEYTPEEEMTPTMTLKFLHGCRRLAEDYLPEYIIRVNSSTFVDFNRITRLLTVLPREKCLAGHNMLMEEETGITEFMHGTAMIFSKDVIEYLLNMKMGPFENKCINDYADDVTLSVFSKKYCETFIDMRPLYKFFTGYTELPSEISCNSRHIFFRILNPPYRMEIDVGIWEILRDHFCP